MSWIQDQRGTVRLALRVTPRARRDEIVGLHGDRLRIRLQSPPVEGKANRALLRFLSQTLGVSTAAVTLVSGEHGRNKTVAVTGLDATSIRQRLTGDPPPQ